MPRPTSAWAVDEAQDLRVSRHAGARQIQQRGQNDVALAHVAQGEFADDKRMRQHASGVEQPGEESIAARRW